MSFIGGRRRRKSKRAGSMLRRAALPGLLTLALLSRGKKKRHGTRKGMRRKTARKAYMKKGGTRRR